MSTFLTQSLTLLLTVGIIALGLPPAAGSTEVFSKSSGAATADDAARYESTPPQPSPALTHSLGFASLLSDTTKAVFVEEEKRNLTKELIVWFIGAAFVGYFIVKVFLQGDTDEQPTPDTGKKLP